MKIPVVWLSFDGDTPAKGYWDHGIIEDLFANKLWNTGYEFEHKDSLEGLDGAIIVFPARAQVQFADRLNNKLNKLKWVVLLLTGDEEAIFPVERINHPNVRMWVMSPRPGRHDKYHFLGTGYPPQIHEFMPDKAPKKNLDWFFAGQVTHDRREQMAKQLKNMKRGEAHFSKGFTQGLPPAEYYKNLSRAKVAPCPSGPETPDSFRLFEALEMGCIPLADTQTPRDDFPHDYWTFFFGEEPPFPVITDYEQLPGYTETALGDWVAVSNSVSSWWLKKKREMALQLKDDILSLTKKEPAQTAEDQITVIIPSSPVPNNPDTAFIQETIDAVRTKLPRSEIIITFDGVREEQQDRTENYEEFKRRVVWLCHHKWGNVLPVIFKEHTHQAGMAREVLKDVKTPTVLYVEQDAPITPDQDFPWENLVEAVTSGEANIIRFHHEALILPDHEHLMFDKEAQEVCGIPMKRTMQWSQRPHLANTAFYRQMLDNYFHPQSRTMIEDVMHGVVESACGEDGLMGWYLFRLWIYTPEGNVKRSYHLDARGEDPKYDMYIVPVGEEVEDRTDSESG